MASLFSFRDTDSTFCSEMTEIPVGWGSWGLKEAEGGDRKTAILED